MKDEADTLWCWVTRTSDGTVCTVGSSIPGLGHTSLSARSEKVARQLQPLARAHGLASGQRVWLRRYDRATDLEDA